MFRVGLNPYGLAYTLGMQGAGTARANDRPIGMAGFVAIAREIGARCIELDGRWLTAMTDAELSRARDDLAGETVICSYWLAQREGETLAEAVRCTAAVGGGLIRLHLTPVLEGSRAAWGPRWAEMVAHGRATLLREAVRARDAGLAMAVEDHQDFGSEELLEMTADAGDNVGIVFDTGNPFSVGEDPVDFARRAGPRIRHVHLKDYVAQHTDEGFRLVRCAIGDGCVPFAEIAAVLRARGSSLTASIEPGALESRHIRLFTSDWWNGYPARSARELGTALARLRRNRLDEGADPRTPWERGAPRDEVIAYEMAQVRRSVENLRTMGFM
ncbi:MAG: 3-oxoisoapionate decarboxylase [Acidobacteriota bacterium]|jgi:sugar phosphate isomerase/epimerase